LSCFDVDETQTKRCEKQNKKIKITRTNIYNKQSIKELPSTLHLLYPLIPIDPEYVIFVYSLEEGRVPLPPPSDFFIKKQLFQAKFHSPADDGVQD
jgi:hypothetical protein